MNEATNELIQQLCESVLLSPATLDSSFRETVARGDTVPEPIATYVTKVRDYAYKVTDDNVTAMRLAGYTEEQIFELTITAALGAALRRREAGLTAIGRVK